MFHTVGGGVDQTAVVGHAPELRDWRPGDPCFAPNVHPSARIEAYVTVDAGAERATLVGRGAWLMKHVHVGHDATVCEDVEIAPGAVIGGGCWIGAGAKIGINACVRPGIYVGAGARIGAGAVVVDNVPAGEVWVGNPARKLRRSHNLEVVA